MKMKTPQLIAAALVGALAITSGCVGLQAAENQTPTDNWKRNHMSFAEVQSIDSHIGKLRFENGYPADKETTTKLYDELDFQRATQAVIWSLPAIGCAGFADGSFKYFGATHNDLIFWEGYLDTKSLALTGNNTTLYAVSILDLAKDGPIVLDIPPGPTGGMVDDFWWRSQAMIGLAGPDAGKGGKFLLLPPGYKGDVPTEGYFVVRCSMNDLNFMIRGFVNDGDLAAAVGIIKKVRVYPYSQRDNPKPNRFFNATGQPVNTLAPEGMRYWELLSNMINNNPVDARDRFFLAMLKPLGIEKGKPFKPDARQMKILEEAMVVGNSMAAANTFEPRISGATFYPGTQWMSAVLLDPSQETEYYSQLDERLHWFFIATYMNPSMALTKPGPGSVYIQSFKDKDGHWLDAAQNYRLRVPANAPAKQFWSITVYDGMTRSMLPNAANKAALTSNDKLKLNADGSVDLYFGPKAPQGLESNWVDTRPSKGFFLWFRSYTPTAAFFDKSWFLPDIEKVK